MKAKLKGDFHMLIEERFSKILTILNRNGSVSVQDLMTALDASESTIRRDLNAMHKKGLLVKVHGGAVAKEMPVHTHDEGVSLRKTQNTDEKAVIGQYAASQIRSNDFVYIDAGTTTEMIIPYIETTDAVFVTNAIGHARLLSQKGCRVYILGGEFKGITEAIVGEEAILSLNKYNFSIGFWGTNGISPKAGCTTPDLKEAIVKQTAMKHCKRPFVLADSSKFSKISSIKFADFDEATIITTRLQQEVYRQYKNIQEVL